MRLLKFLAFSMLLVIVSITGEIGVVAKNDADKSTSTTLLPSIPDSPRDFECGKQRLGKQILAKDGWNYKCGLIGKRYVWVHIDCVFSGITCITLPPNPLAPSIGEAIVHPNLGGVSFGLVLPFFASSSTGKSKIDNRKLWYTAVVFALLALVSLLPFVIAPALARIRVYFFSIILLCIAACYIGIWLNKLLSNKYIALLPIAGFLIYGIIFFTGQVMMMQDFGKQVGARKRYLDSRRGSQQPVYYPKLEMPESLHLIRWADAEMYGDWNKTKEYFELADYIEVGVNETPH